MALSRLALSVVAILFASAAWAQQSPMPAEIAAKLRELGRGIEPQPTAELYAPLQPVEPYQDVKVERDLKYGAADRNLLDVFVPGTTAGARPVLIFVHGGAYVGGNKRRTPTSPFYDNIMLWAAKNSFVGVNMTYRLAPESPWPAGAEDVATAVQWVTNEIGKRGGNPGRIYLMGHSAGAVHVASYVSHPEFHKVKGGGVAGAILLSGIYDLTRIQVSNFHRAYFGPNPYRYVEQSSLEGLLKSDVALMLAVAELDPEGFVLQFDLLKQASCKRASGCARALLLPQHSHMSEVYSINTGDTRLTDQILEFVATGK